MSDQDRRRNQRTVEGAVSELIDLENLVNDAMARLPAVLGRIQRLRSDLSGLLPRSEPAGPPSEAESDDPAQGQLTG